MPASGTGTAIHSLRSLHVVASPAVDAAVRPRLRYLRRLHSLAVVVPEAVELVGVQCCGNLWRYQLPDLLEGVRLVEVVRNKRLDGPAVPVRAPARGRRALG